MNTKLLFLITLTTTSTLAWDFVEKSTESGLNFQHGFDENVVIQEPQMIASGLAIGDVNGDGWDDIFVVTGETKNSSGINVNPNRLLISQKNGKFINQALEYNLNINDVQSSGPLIIDINDDGDRDIIFGSVGSNPLVTYYENNGNSQFSKVANSFPSVNTFGISAGDTDEDGDLELFISRWLQDTGNAFWQNTGNGNFIDITPTHIDANSYRNSFTPIFVDINNDNWVDLLLTSDFSASKYFINDTNGFMLEQDRSQIDDENGMGAAIGDYDNDGDFDWFATAIYDEDGNAEGSWGVSGNRLYNNDGSGNFTDVSVDSNVNDGQWGWGACFADFNNDMFLDIFHVNGFPSLMAGEPDFENDASKLFINDKNGGFVEMSVELNLIDTGMGRSIICFDNDRDGDIDILIANNRAESKFYQNNLDNNNNHITIKLVQSNKNIDAIGAKIQLTTGETTQIRQIIAGGNFASSSPTAQHFGLSDNSSIDSILITWPDDSTQQLTNVDINQYLVINKQVQNNSIHGKVLNNISNQTINNLTIQVFSEDGEFIKETTTDVNGNYLIENLNSKTVKLVTLTPDYENQAYPNINCGLRNCDLENVHVINLSDSNNSIDFNLTPNSHYYPSLSGLWYNRDQSGHGLQIEVISSNNKSTLFVSWYSHFNGEPIWLSGVGTLNKGIANIELVKTKGTSFPPQFNPDDVVRESWGNLNLNFTDINNATIQWQTDFEGFQNGSLDITRLTNLTGTIRNDTSFDACQSGSYYNPEESGHGIMLEVLGVDASSIFISWFTYNNQNEQFWLIGNNEFTGDTVSIDLFYTKGSDFPPNFDPSESNNNTWGVVTLTKIDENHIDMEWVPNDNHLDYGSSSTSLVKLTNIKGINGLDCSND